MLDFTVGIYNAVALIGGVLELVKIHRINTIENYLRYINNNDNRNNKNL